MENVNGVTSADLVLWKRADRTLFGLLLDEHGRALVARGAARFDARNTGDEDGAFLGILPKGTPLTRLYASSIEGHYECILGVNYVQLPAEAVLDRRQRPLASDAKATIPQRKLPRPK